MTEPAWGLVWGPEASIGHSVRGRPHRSSFTSRSPTRFSPGRPKKDPCGQGRGRGQQSLWRCPESSLEQRLPPGGSVPELSPEDCPSLEEGLPHCNPVWHEGGEELIPLEKHVGRSWPRAQPLIERFHHVIVDHFPPLDIQPLGTGVITMIMAERATGPSGSVEEHTGKPSLGGARQRHEGNLEPSTPGATENLTQSPSYPEGHGAPTNGLLIPVSVTQCNMSCFQQGCLTASVSLSDGVYKECRCNAQDTCSIVWKVRWPRSLPSLCSMWNHKVSVLGGLCKVKVYEF